jgi:uncharacterized protein (DUF1015 family)
LVSYVNPNFVNLLNDFVLELEALEIANCKDADIKFIIKELNEATMSIASNSFRKALSIRL